MPTTTSDAAPDAASETADTVTINRTARQAWLPPLILLLVLAAQLPNLLWHGGEPAVRHQHAVDLRFWCLTMPPIFLLISAVNFLPIRVELTDTALVVRRPLRRRRVLEWRHIQAVLVDVRGSRRRVAVYGDDFDGHRVLLPVPFTAFLVKDPHFAEKFHLIGQTWLARRGPDWVPQPPPSLPAQWTR